MLRLSHCVFIASALFASAAWAQAPAKAPAPATAPAKVDPAVKKCMDAYNAENAAMNQAYAAGVKANKIDKAEQAKWNELTKKLKEDIAKAKQGGVTLQECEATRKELNAKHAQLNQMLASAPKEDPALKKCLVDYDAENKALAKKHDDAKKAGKIDAKEEALWAKERKEMNDKLKDAKQGGISMQECQQLRAIQKKRSDDLDKMIASAPKEDPALKQCKDAYDAENKALAKKHDDGKKAGKIDPNEEAKWAAERKQQNDRLALLQKGGLSLQECQELRGFQKKRSDDLDKMLASGLAQAPGKAPAAAPVKK